jgi:hypothetical protein
LCRSFFPPIFGGASQFALLSPARARLASHACQRRS